MSRLQQALLYLAVLTFAILGNSCNQQQTSRLEAVNYDLLFDNIKTNDGKLYVVNFWATWCKPCMEELPYFLEVDDTYNSKDDYQMILVSLDKSSALQTEVKRVVRSMQIKPDVLLLDDAKRMNEWIPAINDQWSGSIPATALYKNGKQLEFHEGKL
ncbi:MAG: redoxin domain-containing protein, partial [Bacteroidetes bacterium]|nr:redoxin domain-containing protein [Bacteroidota bacterium]